MSVGILQGRLSPSRDGRLQFFPLDWVHEFDTAKAIGFGSIEWLCDSPEMETDSNPLLSFEGRVAIGHAVLTTRISVSSVCADWYMKYDLRRPDQVRLDWLLRVIDAATHTTERRVLIPLLEQNAPTDVQEELAIRNALTSILPVLEKLHVSIGFETEMDCSRLIRFIDSFQSPWIGAYYDIGNCTSYGFNCPNDIRALGARVKGVHVKDRKNGSAQSMFLGTGDADIAGSLRALEDIGYKGTLVMQALRGDNYLQDARDQLAYLHAIQKEISSDDANQSV